MGKSRLEAFSDGVLAIVITIMVLGLKVPHGASWQSLLRLIPACFGYVLSFIYIWIYWNNHHHVLQACKPASLQAGHGRHPLGQPASAVLVVPFALCHSVDGRK